MVVTVTGSLRKGDEIEVNEVGHDCTVWCSVVMVVVVQVVN